MTRLQELRQAKSKKVQEMRSLLEAAKTEKRSLNEDESPKFEEMKTAIASLDVEIKREEEVADHERSLNQPNPEDAGANPEQSTTLPAAGRSHPDTHGGREYRSLFGGEERSLSNDGFRSFRDWLMAVHRGVPDERLVQERSMGTDQGSSGGFLVPTEFAAELLDVGLEDEIMRPRCRVFPMMAMERKIPGWDGADHSSTLYGGFSGQWLAEGETATVTDEGKFRSITLKAKKLAIFTSASNELISDAFSFEDILNGALTKAISWFLDSACLSGNGAGQPLGIFNCPSTIVVEAENGQNADTVLWENVVKMFSRMHPSCRKNAIWIANDTIIPQLLTMRIVVGTGGSHINQIATTPVFQETSGRFFLLGKEVFFTEKVPALGEQGDITLIDPTQYALGLRKEILIERSNAVHWSSDKTAYRAIIRADGLGTWDKAVTPKNGDSLSWCVTLEAR